MIGYYLVFVNAPGLIAEEVRTVIVDQRSEEYYEARPRTAKPLDQAVSGLKREEVAAYAEPDAEDSCSSNSLGKKAHPMSGA